MKKLLNAGLALSTLLSLTACGGQAQMVPTAGYPQQTPVTGQNAYFQNNYAYQAPATTPQGYNQAVQPGVQQQAAPQTAPTRISAARVSAPQGTVAPRPTAPRATTPAPRPAAAAPKPAAPSAEQIGAELIAKSIQKFDQIQNFSIIATAFEKNEKGVTNLKLKLHFQKPTRTKMEIVEHTNSLFVGAKLLYESGSDQVTGRPGGMMSFMKMTLPLSDDRISSRRGYRLDQIDTLAIVNRLLKSGQQPRVLGKANVGGREVAMLEFTGANPFDQTITREVLGIDMQDQFVRSHEMYVGADLIYSLKLQQVDIDTQIPASEFTI